MKYIATVRGSQEVTLYGSAAVDFWTPKLATEGLMPVVKEDRVEVILTAVASRWMGVRFSEFMLAISVADELGGPAVGIYLGAAYNTSRSFTFVEKHHFHTPYAHGQIAVNTAGAVGFTLRSATKTLVAAQQAAPSPTATTLDVDQHVPIYLPGRQHVYYARLCGNTVVMPFNHQADRIAIHPAAHTPILEWLIESGFQGKHWHVRADALHSRSKSFRRPSIDR